MEKQRVKTINGKRLVTGDRNLITRDEILVEEVKKANGEIEVTLHKRGLDGTIKAITPQGGGGGGADDWNIINQKAYGIEWTLFKDETKEDPMDCNRVGNMEYHKTLPCHQWKGCIANAEKVNYYLDPNDWSKKTDGTPSKLDGTDGTVRVEIPTFYYKSWKDDNKANPTRKVMVSPEKIDDTWHEFPHILLDAYYATLDQTNTDSPKAASVINTAPEFRGGYYRNASDKFDSLLAKDPRLTDLGKAITNLTVVEMSNFAKNADSENINYEVYKMIVFWMPAIEFATFNIFKDFTTDLTAEGYAKGGLGQGCLNANWVTQMAYNRYGNRTPNGFTNEFGNGSGAKLLFANGESVHNSTDPDATTVYTVPSDLWVNRYRGIENIWGDTGYLLEGILAGTAVKITDNPENYSNNASTYDKIIVGVNGSMDVPFPADFILGDSCELLGLGAGVQDMLALAPYTTVNLSNPCASVLMQIGLLSGNDSNPLVFTAGGAAFGGGGPGVLAADGASLGVAADGGGFRTLSRINGDSKKLQYREVV